MTTLQSPPETHAPNPVTSAGDPPEGAPRRARSRELEGYRGLAALTIVAFHVVQYAAQSGAELPFVVEAFARFETVDVLFLMSAYLLTLSYARAALDGTSLLPAREFLFRRAVRIVPLYWIAVTTVWALRNPALPGDWRDLVEHLLFVQVFDRERIFYTLGPTWSMSLEVMFYLSLVVLGALGVRACRGIVSRRRRVALLLAGTLTLSVIPVVWNSVAFLVADIPFDNWPVYFGPQARFGAFAAGMTLAVIVAARRNAPLFSGVWPAVLRIVGLAIVGYAAVITEEDSLGQVLFHDIAAVGWFVFLASTVLAVGGQRWSAFLSTRLMTWLGLISYSTYIWHEPIMMMLEDLGVVDRTAAGLPWAILVVVLASVLAGWASFHVIEKPTSKLRSMSSRSGEKRDYYPELSGRR